MIPCSCGKGVRLRAFRISVNRKRGVAHYLEHLDGTRPCIPGEWSCSALKPYPKDEAQSEWRKLIARFDAAVLGDKEAK